MGRRLATLCGAVLFAVSVWVLVHELRQLGFETVRSSLASVPSTAIVTALALTALNYLVLTWHDRLAFVYAGLRRPCLPVAIASFVGYALSNSVGFAMLSGTSARYRFYSRWGIGAGDLSRIVLFYSTTFWLGLCLLGGASLVASRPPGLERVIPMGAAVALGSAAILLVVAYATACIVRRRPIEIGRLTLPLPPPWLMALQTAISAIDWLLAASVLFVLLPAPRPHFLTAAGAFAGAQLLGLISQVPGGLGVFEGLMLLLLGPQIAPAALVPALALYRVVYYLVPLAVALAILFIDEALQRRGAITRWSRLSRGVAVWAAPRILALFTFVSGAVLLLSGATPAEPGRLAWLARAMPLPLVELSHFTASLVGVLLLLLAQAIARRVDAAFYLTAAALAAGSVASILKGADYEEAAILAVVLVAILGARQHFTRRARVFETPMSIGWLTATGVVVAASVWLGFFAYRQVAYSGDLWWAFAFEADASRFLRASVAVTAVALAVAVRELLRPIRVRRTPADEATLADAAQVIAEQPLTSPFLVHLGDKSLLWSGDHTAFLMYAARGGSLVALGDPVGPPERACELIHMFLSYAHADDLRPVFYEASARHIADYIDHGLTALKIGEEARVRLEGFSLSGARYKAFRASIHRLEREGASFRVIEPAEVARLMPELQEVSDEWLSMKRTGEKGFSLGYFNPDYIRRFPAALVERDGRVEAFANLWAGAGRVELSPDLMRHRSTAPRGVMDALFAYMMAWGRDQGYEWFNLGMAPLSGLPDLPAGRRWSSLGRFVYRHGEFFYNFRGLRAYKEKFDPEWEPRYLVYPGGLALPRVLTDVTTLIAGGYRQLLRRRPRRAA